MEVYELHVSKKRLERLLQEISDRVWLEVAPLALRNEVDGYVAVSEAVGEFLGASLLALPPR